MEVLRHEEDKYYNKQFVWCILEGLRVDFPKKIENLSLTIEIGYVGVLRRQEHKYGPENFLSLILTIYRSIIQNISCSYFEIRCLWVQWRQKHEYRDEKLTWMLVGDKRVDFYGNSNLNSLFDNLYMMA